tara:strand:- start:940 stop:1230 length:291 start_codon:yes stop_codon:yes gene_type:complete
MAITKSTEINRIEVVNIWNIQIRTDTVIKEDGTEISRSLSRKVLTPFVSLQSADESWQHTATELSGEDAQVQAIANAAWTDDVKDDYKTWREAQSS